MMVNRVALAVVGAAAVASAVGAWAATRRGRRGLGIAAALSGGLCLAVLAYMVFLLAEI